MTKPNSELKLGNAPGVSATRIEALDEAAAAYDIVKKERQECTKREVAAKKKVIDLLHANEKILGRDPKGAIHYKMEELTVDLTPTEEKLKVKVKGDDADDDDENED